MIVSRITPGNTFIYDKKEVASKALHQDLPHPSATSNQWAGCLETEPPSQSHAGTGSAAPASAALNKGKSTLGSEQWPPSLFTGPEEGLEA